MFGIYNSPNNQKKQSTNSSNFANTFVSNQHDDSSHACDHDFISEKVYQNLPQLLKRSSDIFTERREKDIFLTACLSAFGGCFHNVVAHNMVDKTNISPNIFSFIIAPPASGKNVLTYACKVIKKISETFKHHAFVKTKGLLIPGNITSSGMIEMLKMNSGIGVNH